MDRNSAIWAAAIGFGAGAATMYLLDPDRGARRRALIGDKVTKANHKLRRATKATKRDLANRGQGLLIEAKNKLRPAENTSDEVLEARVRSKMGRTVSHPHTIRVSSSNGNVTLTGSILEGETDALLRCVRSVAGVNSVASHLTEYRTQDEIARANDQSHRDRSSESNDLTDLGSAKPRAVH